MNLSPLPLHIPDGFLNLIVSVVSWIITIVLVGIAIRRSRIEVNERQIPFMGIMAAFIFAAQMINFPIAGGTSGHMLGGALAAIILGPWTGMLVMTSVIALQALLFQDGGLLVMGANILNMGLITSLIGFGLYRAVSNRSQSTRLTISGVAAWLSVIAGALLTSIQLWLSGTSPARLVFPAMLGVHAVIGIGEALITVGALAFLFQVRPDLVSVEKTEAHGDYKWVVGGILISIIIVILSPLASINPDGLERVAGDLEFLFLGQESPYELLPDYNIPVLGDSGLSTILAGFIGILLVFIITYGIGRGLKHRKNSAP
ncbi:MAG: energy-coupling factor ABC transporter permease [Anaerolineales bacterium]|jgi:cobalt/nickel transport system permease protein